MPQTGLDIKFTPNTTDINNLVNLTNLGGILNKRPPIQGDPFADALETNMKTFNTQSSKPNTTSDAFNFVKSEIKINQEK